MKKNNLKYMIFTSSLLLSFSSKIVFANQLLVNQDITLSADESYTGNVSGAGILANSNNSGNNWVVDTNGNNIDISNNQTGILVTSGGKLNIKGSGTETITASGPILNFIKVDGGSSLLVEDININRESSSSSTGYANGLYNAGTTNIIGNIDGSNYMNISENIGNAWSENSGINNNGVLNIKYMDIDAGKNQSNGLGGGYALRNSGSGVVSIEGIASGTNVLDIGNNFANNYNTHSILNDGTITIKNMDVLANNNDGKTKDSTTNGEVVSIYNKGNLYLIGSQDKVNKLEIKDSIANKNNLAIQNDKNLSIKDMDIEITGNKSVSTYFVGIVNNIALKLEGDATKSNTLNISNNIGETNIIAYRNQGAGSVSTMTNMNIITDNNVGKTYAVGFENYGTATITGDLSGTNFLQANGNQTNSGTGVGIANRGGVLNINNTNIEASGNKSTNGSAYGLIINGGSSNIIGVASGSNNMVIKDNISSSASGLGFGIYNLNATTKIENMNMYISNNKNTSTSTSSYGIYNNKDLSIKGVSSRNNLSLIDNNFGFFSATDNARTSVENMNISFKGADFVYIANAGQFTLKNSMVATDSTRSAFSTNGAGIINVLAGSQVYAGNSYLFYTGPASNGVLNVDSSKVYGKVDYVTGGTATLNLLSNSFWKTGDNSNVTNLANNNSNISMLSSTAGNTLTVKDYVGTNGTIKMSGSLGYDNSVTDKIIIDSGSATGSTVIDYQNMGGAGGNTVEGIKIVDAQNGSVISSSAFSLNGGMIDTGAYAYKLYQGNTSGTDNQSMFLRSTGELTDTAKTIANEPSMILGISRAGMNSLMKRLGEIRANNPVNYNGVWARSYAQSMTIDDMIKTKVSIYGFEGGYDKELNVDVKGRVYLGAMAGYLHTDNIKTKQDNGAQDGSGNGKTPSVGAYATWVAPNGLFVDGAFRNFWQDTNMTSYGAGNQVVKYNIKRQMSVASLELGRMLKYKVKSDSIVFEPKAEIAYGFSKGKEFRTNLGDSLKYGDTQSISTKATMLVGYEKKFENNMFVQPYLQASIINEFDGKTNIEYSGTEYDSDLGGTSFEFGGGLNMQLDKNTSTYGSIMYETGESIESIYGNIGVRYTW